jgi:citrate lyase beta subunit
VKLLDDHLKEVAVGEAGMIGVAEDDPGLFMRYWNQPEETEQVHREGWFLTGDYARQDAEGYFWFLGRRDDLINTFGYRISPHEVERVMKTHPAVADCVVVGEEIERHKTLVAACVIRGPGAQVSAQELLDFGATHLAAYKCPKRIHFIPDYPRTKNGKVLRKQLKAWVEGQAAEVAVDFAPKRQRRMTATSRPRRSMLYVAGDNRRQLEKARTLPADSLILDLQESVVSAHKEAARDNVVAAVQTGGYGPREVVVRVNALDSLWGRDDVAAVAALPVDAVLFPRVQGAADVEAACLALDAAGGIERPLMAMIESPRGVLRAAEIVAASPRVVCLVMGTTDLAGELRVNLTPDRLGLLTALSWVVLAARAHQRAVVDGPHLDLKDPYACELACRQGRDLGFDGKTVIHPAQLPYTNDAFTPKPADVDRARRIVEALEQARDEDRSAVVVDGRVVEPAQAQCAYRLLALDRAIRALTGQ